MALGTWSTADLHKMSFINPLTLSEAADFETLNNLFPSNCDSLDPEIHTNLRQQLESTPTLDTSVADHPISAWEKTGAIKNMCPRQATGPDGVPLPF